MEDTAPSYFGLNIYTDTQKAALTQIQKNIETKTPTFIACLNVYKMSYAFRMPGFAKILGKANMLITDGVSVLLTARLLGCRVKERITGVQLFGDLLEVADQRRYRIFFLASQETVIQTVLDKIKEDYPNLIVAGHQNGFFEDPEAVAQRIKESDSDILFVAMGSPKQELFMERFSDKLGVPIRMGVGGSFDVFSGLTPRAPALSQKLGLEWLYRCVIEPRKYLRRYSQTIPIFLYEFTKHYLSFDRSGRSTG